LNVLFAYFTLLCFTQETVATDAKAAIANAAGNPQWRRAGDSGDSGAAGWTWVSSRCDGDGGGHGIDGLSVDVSLAERGGGGGELDLEATRWLHVHGLGELASLLGIVGSTLADLAMLTAEDVSALQLKTLVRRRLRGQLSQLEGSRCVVATAVVEVRMHISLTDTNILMHF
jgi:hypothetical protein